MNNVHVVITSNDSLTEEAYSFWYDERENALVLNAYKKMVRASTRHKFTPYTIVEQYDRTMPRRSSIKVEDVPLTTTVERMALDIFIMQLKVTK